MPVAGKHVYAETPEYTEAIRDGRLLDVGCGVPEPSRAVTLGMIRRALKPGGLLLMQEMEREPRDEVQRPAFLLRRLVHGGSCSCAGRTGTDQPGAGRQAATP
ncbi:hypothetical protein [Nonomuraea jiangxiensis]|uniref:Uncharacterized protein n=1 Tax=Nonomuraea jiangxiensis TaxID=633440 RepID=A0A1G8LI86_9ACTN|nr:hypothetical protein [Nonomuraea jiangxiensis]SDI55345.1 hypothetical protein SAMN05421869_106101 [Nonomuraea jiangxiensis]